MNPPGSATAPQSLGQIEALIERLGADPRQRRELVALLREHSVIYAGKSSGEADRVRGFILARFGDLGLPEEALPYVMEELETGRDPYTVAGAARALCGAARPPDEAAKLLKGALKRIAPVDTPVDLSRLEADSLERPATATAELLAALDHAERPRQCCAGLSRTPPQPFDEGPFERLGSIAIEDQDKNRTTFGDLFGGRAAALAFFYTRCMNPNKCSLTVTKLGRLARLVNPTPHRTGILVAGMTYDPAFDDADRLSRYGEERRMAFGPDCRLLRTTGSFDELRAVLPLAVGYGEATVNRHAIELFLLSPQGAIRPWHPRRLWHEREVAEALVASLAS